MANKKLSELSPLSAAPDGADILAITDTSTTLTKKVTITELMESWATVETTHGTASIKNFGTSANELVSLDSTGKLPAVDGSQLLLLRHYQVTQLRSAQVRQAPSRRIRRK
mgnify:CR=1 FL=1